MLWNVCETDEEWELGREHVWNSNRTRSVKFCQSFSVSFLLIGTVGIPWYTLYHSKGLHNLLITF